ncbi:MAG: GLPGLI family protein [Arcicella sp.]|nr:GLPGLI family protein [Arcicella sp.]
MKIRLLFLLVAGLTCSEFSYVAAQTNQGMIFYEETRVSLTPEKRKQIEEQMPDPNIREMIFKKLEENSKSLMTLSFNQDVSSYKLSDGQGIDSKVKSLGEGTGKSYFKDLQKQSYISQADVLGKSFLITDNLKKINWKLTGDGKQIGKMACQKATATVGKYEVEAYFALEIPVSSGPANYWGLPGLIVELKEKGGKTFAFKEFKDEKPSDDQLMIPTEGKKVSQKEYDEILAQKTKELTGGSDATNSGGVKIIKMN